ncbi:MAG: hypothetical protein H0U29_01300 [Acidimicrobiia bacterium]|nr:hypothetical protein [Acidimicrobiia bacterium]
MSTTQWYWCLTHQQPETGEQRDDPDNSLGPYPTEEAARNWKATSEARNEAWDTEDERWSGDNEPPQPRG